MLAVTAGCFALLVSVAASHLHIGPDADEACALCAAFAGKLEGPSLSVPMVAIATVVHTVCITPVARLLPPPPARLLPPYLRATAARLEHRECGRSGPLRTFR